MTNCPPKLRGDLSKWLCEINTGVYVGNVSSRVRDALWERVCQNLKNGQATLVFTTAGERNPAPVVASSDDGEKRCAGGCCARKRAAEKE